MARDRAGTVAPVSLPADADEALLVALRIDLDEGRLPRRLHRGGTPGPAPPS